MRSKMIAAVLVLAATAPLSAAQIVPTGSFRSVELLGGGNVLVMPGPAQRVTILEGSIAHTSFSVDRHGRLRISACNRGCPRNYKLRIRIQSPRVPDLAVMGGGHIQAAAGFRPQSRLAAAVTGGGRVDARSVGATNVSAAVSGGGQVLVRATGILSAAVRGGGSIRYVGRPQVSSAIMGGGSVSPAN